MRKILSQKEIEKKRKTKTLTISVIMLGLLLFGTIGYGFMSGPKNSDDDKDNIKNIGGRWEITHNDNVFYLENSPEEVKNVSVNIQSKLRSLTGSTVYISSDNEAIFSEIHYVLRRYTKTQQACYGPCPDKPDMPEKNCTDNLIVWQDSPENKVYQEDNCIFIEGDLKAVDAFIYTILDFH
jgi:hypothetical protein